MLSVSVLRIVWWERSGRLVMITGLPAAEDLQPTSGVFDDVGGGIDAKRVGGRFGGRCVRCWWNICGSLAECHACWRNFAELSLPTIERKIQPESSL